MFEKISSVDYVSDGVLQALFDALNFHFSPVIVFCFIFCFVFLIQRGKRESILIVLTCRNLWHQN